MRQRYFTPEEANEALSELIGEIRALRTLAAELRQLASSLQERAEAGQTDEDTARDARIFREKRERAEALVQRIRATEVDIKGLEPALLDFPALRMGREVYLCWREGEDEIAFWHPIEEGFAGRRPLADEEPGIWEWVN